MIGALLIPLLQLDEWLAIFANARVIHGQDVSTDDASWTNQSKRDVSNQMKIIGRIISQLLFACARALNTGRHHRTLHVVPSTAASTAQKTRAQASAQAARKLRLFKHSEIAARAVDDARPEAR